MNTLTAIPSMPVITVNNIQMQDSNCSVHQIRPWIRYFARMVDLFFFSFMIGIILALYAPTMAARLTGSCPSPGRLAPAGLF